LAISLSIALDVEIKFLCFFGNNVINYDISRFTDFDISLLWIIVNVFFIFL